MARYAILENDKIVNVVEAEADFAATQGWVEIPDNIGIGDIRSGDKFFKVITSVKKQAVSPIRFKLLFTQAERIAIKTVSASDNKLADFYDLLDDPRLTEVDLALPATQEAVSYTINAIKSGLEYTDQQATSRINDIMQGVMQ